MSTNIEIVFTLTAEQKKDLLELYSGEFWCKNRTMKDVETALKYSSFYIGIVEKPSNKLIAFCRVLSDYFIYAHIYDVIINKEYRGSGLGKKLIDTIINHPSLNMISKFELTCRKHRMSFYEQFGFSIDYGESIAMRFERKSL